MPAPLTIFLPRALSRYATRLLRNASRTSRPIGLGRYTPSYRSPASSASELGRYSQRRHDWNRTTIPLYGSPRVNIPVAPVLVPGRIQFEWENAHELPLNLPNISFRPPRSSRRYAAIQAPTPQYEMLLRVPPRRFAGASRLPPEPNRRRHDAKLNFGLNRLYRLMHRTYGNYTEYMEFLHAFQNNWQAGPLAVATALSLNEGIDRAYGARGRFLRDRIYRDPDLWQLPVGYDTLSRLWR